MTEDSMATSRAIDALPDVASRAFADALVDRVTAIVGNHQVNIHQSLAEIHAAHILFDQSLAEIRYHVAEANRRIQDLANALEMHVGDNGRLTRLLEAATARGRRKGKAEERAKGANETI